MKHLKRGKATLLLLVFPLVCFWKIILTHNEYSFFVSNDAAQHWYPWYQYIARWIHSGTVPLWDTALQSGRPLLGEMRPGVLYPFNLLLFALGSKPAGLPLLMMDLSIMAAVLLASIFQYTLA